MGGRRGVDGLTDKERKICLAVDAGLTDKEAFRAACPDSKATDMSASAIAGRMRKRPHCVAYLKRLQAKAERRHDAEKDRIIEELVNIAFSDMGDLADWGPEGVTVKRAATLTPAQRRTVAKITVPRAGQPGEMKIELHNKLRALDKLCWLLGLHGPGWHGGAVRSHGPEDTVREMSDVERAQRLAAILRAAEKKTEH